jgi:hypothetical protein
MESTLPVRLAYVIAGLWARCRLVVEVAEGAGHWRGPLLDCTYVVVSRADFSGPGIACRSMGPALFINLCA